MKTYSTRFTILALALGGALIALSALRRETAAPPVLEFSGPPVVTDVTETHATITYLLRRNEACPTTVHIRWYDPDRKAFDVGSARSVESTQARVTDDFEPFAITIALPPGIARPVYAPIFTPSAACRSSETVHAPLAEVRR